jgi:chromosome segregation ATPase
MLTERAEVAEVDALLAELDAAEAAYMEWMRERRREYREAVEAHHAAVDEAIRTGKPPPLKKPETLSETDHAERVAAFVSRRQVLQDQRQRAIAVVGPAIEQEARERWEATLAKVRDLMAQLDTLAEGVAEAQRAVTECRTAQAALDLADPAKGARRMEPLPTVTAAFLVQTVEQGGDPLTPRPDRHLGLRGGPFHEGVPDGAWEPPVREIAVRPG